MLSGAMDGTSSRTAAVRRASPPNICSFKKRTFHPFPSGLLIHLIRSLVFLSPPSKDRRVCP
jgi:hypothetical protein